MGRTGQTGQTGRTGADEVCGECGCMRDLIGVLAGRQHYKLMLSPARLAAYGVTINRRPMQDAPAIWVTLSRHA